MKVFKRCPNCGGIPELHRKKNKFYYECSGDCWTMTNKHDTEEAAREEWNSLEENEETTTKKEN